MSRTEKVSVPMSIGTRERLEQIAKELDCSLAAVIRIAIRYYLVDEDERQHSVKA